MRSRFAWAGAAALAVTFTSQIETRAAYTNLDGLVITNGTIIITTRSANDDYWHTASSSSIWDAGDNRGPGNTPGDCEMAALLQDNGYSTHMMPEKALAQFVNGFSGYTFEQGGNLNDPFQYYTGGAGETAPNGSNVFLSAMLVIMSGSGSSADMAPPNTNNISIITGEHTTLGDSATAPGSHSELFLYANKVSNNIGLTGGNGVSGNPGLYMRVLQPNHPIFQGIPLDATNRVKIWRDHYPDENSHVLTPGGNPNYVISWTGVDCNPGKSVPASDLTLLGTLDYPNTNQVVFAAMEKGGQLTPNTADSNSPWNGYTVAPSRIVQFFVNENGSGNSRRSFNCLTQWGRILFLRTCKWAMYEDLTPFQNFGIIDVGQISPGVIRLGWTGSIHNNYRIDGTADFMTWLPIVDSITNNGDGVRVTRTLNIAAAQQAVFMRVAALP
jgi:hypothetical protein